MKKLSLILTLLFSFMFSSLSFAEWTKVAESDQGNTYYVDYERIRKNNGFVYFWTMSDYLKPNYLGNFSAKVYMEGDCKLFRQKYLSDIYYNGQMGAGEITATSNVPDKEWTYPSPNSVDETFLKTVCDQ